MKHPILLALTAIFIWSMGPMLGRFISFKTQFLLTSVAYFFAFLVLVTYFFFQKKISFSQEIKKIKLRYFLIGLFGYSIFSFSFIQAFRAYNSASEPTILNYTWPVFMVLFTEIFFRFKKKKSLYTYGFESVGILLGFLAIVILVTRGDLSSLQITNIQGLGWGLLTGGAYGFFSAYSSTVPTERQGIFLLSSIFSSFIVTSLLAITEIPLLLTISLADFLIAIFLGIFVNGVAYIAWTRAMHLLREKQVNISSVASMTFFLPLLSLIIIAITFQEKILFHPTFILVLILLLLSSIFCQKAESFRQYDTSP